MKRIAALCAVFLVAALCAFNALALDENYALDYESWSDEEGVQSVIVSEQGFNSSVKYFVDEAGRIIYVHVSYTADCLKNEGNRISVSFNAQNDERTNSFIFDENGFVNYDGKDFKLAQSFSRATEYGQDITFAVEFSNKKDYSENLITLMLSINGNNYTVMERRITLLSATVSKTTVKATEKTTKHTTVKTTKAATKRQTTTKAAGTTKYTPPADANYFTGESVSGEAQTEALSNESGVLITASDSGEEKSLSNPAKIILAGSFVLAVTGAGLLVKSAVAGSKDVGEASPKALTPEIDEGSEEIMNRYINDDYDAEDDF